ncbi:hypothetical protein CTheo_4985 [Ceratobasidium theobromae]|uniref:Protein SMG7 n=1 Tax=Ceratobasidium theobromae TaxID=1582974 RepID=A0A5N5QJC0_9AGAM|nr:hypothetical protein CTheo_4985 [Ceratobasidium theobromae]
MGDPSKLARDVKGLVADFREELKLREPWDREIDIQFKRIQRKYKEILFDFPFSRQAHSVDQVLWTDTSYALISRYRGRIDPVRSSPANNKNVVENRKILQKFLAFLAAEGTFWSGIVSRLVRAHGLNEANSAMTALGMNIVEFENRESLVRRGSGAGQAGLNAASSEEPVSPSHPPPTHEHRSNKLLTVFRALIYLGDLARYREQYGTHPNKANSDAGSKRSRGGRRGKDKGGDKVHEKPYSKAEGYYLQAQLLSPDYGNPFNQLAIIYAYQHDYFGAALNYYRALCVKKPFPTAQDNLIRTLGKCLDADRELWRERKAQEGGGEGQSHGSGGPVDTGKGKRAAQAGGKPGPDNDGLKNLESRFKQDVALLHALWTGKCRLPKLARHTHNVLASFASLVSRRLLPAATIVHVLVLALGALWKVQMFKGAGSQRESRRSKSKGKEREDSQGNDLEPDVPLETRIAAHLFALCTVLLEVGTREIQEGIREAGGFESDDQQLVEKLAQRITGTFRRTLPALRIANKWIKGNLRHIQRHSQDDGKDRSVEFDTPGSPLLPNTMRPSVASFWNAWARFESQLAAAFPFEVLPMVAVKLEEDVEMKGFSPLERGIGGASPHKAGGNETHATDEEGDTARVHPNEEQLMRIRDLIVDAKYVANSAECPVSIVNGEFVLIMQQPSQNGNGSVDEAYHRWGDDEAYESNDEAKADQELFRDDSPHLDDDRATVSTRTEDDPVRLAMDAVLSESEEDEDEEEILYPQSHQRHVNVSLSPPGSVSPEVRSGPVWPLPTPSFLSEPSEKPNAQPNRTPPTRTAGTTAEDLLNRVLNGAPTFLNMPSSSASDPSSVITSNTSFVGKTISMHGPTPSFLAQSTQSPPRNPPIDNFSVSNPPFSSAGPNYGPKPHQKASLSPSMSGKVSPFSNPPSHFSGASSPSQLGSPFAAPTFSSGRSSDSSFLSSHVRVSSLTGAASIWTPAPQEVSNAPQLGMHARAGSMRANSISGNLMHPASANTGFSNGLPAYENGIRSWTARNQGFGEIQPPHGYGTIPRQRTYTTPTEMPRWG